MPSWANRPGRLDVCTLRRTARSSGGAVGDATGWVMRWALRRSRRRVSNASWRRGGGGGRCTATRRVVTPGRRRGETPSPRPVQPRRGVPRLTTTGEARSAAGGRRYRHMRLAIDEPQHDLAPCARPGLHGLPHKATLPPSAGGRAVRGRVPVTSPARLARWQPEPTAQLSQARKHYERRGRPRRPWVGLCPRPVLRLGGQAPGADYREWIPSRKVNARRIFALCVCGGRRGRLQRPRRNPPYSRCCCMRCHSNQDTNLHSNRA